MVSEDIERFPVLANADCFEVIDSLPSFDTLKDRGFLAPPVSRDDEHNVPADRFFGSVPKHPLRALIPAGDYAVQIFADDRVVGGIHDRSQQTGCSLGQFPLGNIHAGRVKEDHLPLIVENGIEREIHNVLGAVRPMIGKLS